MKNLNQNRLETLKELASKKQSKKSSLKASKSPRRQSGFHRATILDIYDDFEFRSDSGMDTSYFDVDTALAARKTKFFDDEEA